MSKQKNTFEIPQSERQSWGSLAMIWIGSMICVPCLMIGGVMISGLSLFNTMLACAIGYGIVITYMCFMGMQACDTGLPTVKMASAALGEKGAKYIISLLLAVACIGWFGLQSNVCGSAFSSMMATMTGIQIPVSVSSVIWGVIMLLTAIYGYKALAILNYIAVPSLVLVCGWGAFAAIAKNGTAVLSTYTPPAPMSMVTGISLAVATFALGGVISGDYSRYAKNRIDVIKSSVIGVLPAGLVMIMMGAIMSLVAGTYDIGVVLTELGVPAFGLVALVLATWTTNAVNAYSGGIAVADLAGVGEDKRPLMTALAGILGTVLAAVGMISKFESFLSLLTSFIPPVAGVIIANYWIVAKGKKENLVFPENINTVGLISFIIGVAVAYVTANVWVFFVSPVNGMVAAIIAYVVLDKLIPQKQSINA